MNKNTTFLHVKDVAKLLGVSQGTALKLFHRTGFPTRKVGRYLLVSEADFFDWMDEQKAGGAK